MQQGSDFSSSYYPHQYAPAPGPPPNPYPNPSPAEFLPSNPIQPPAFPSAPAPASAPPYSHYSAAAAAAGFPASAPYPSYAQTSVDLIPNLPPSAPSYTPPQPQPQHPQSQPQPQHQSQSQFPSYQPYNASPYPPEPSPTAPYPHLQQSYYPHDSNQPPAAPTPNYASNPNPNPSQSLHSTFSSSYPSYDNSSDSAVARFDHGGGSGYFNESSINHSLNVSSAYPDAGFRYDRPGSQDDGLGDGVYRYDGGRAEPYGARGTGSSAKSSWSAFDDYGRSTSFSGKEQMASMGKIVRAVPKADAQQDVKNGVQKFRVKLLPEGGGQSTMDVLCQIGLDGIRMLDPSTNRTLRIYPLETVTRWEVTDTSIYTFWSKSSVDIEPRRIRLQSNSYTTSTILDTVTAATVQLKEMGGRDSLGKSNGTDAGKLSDQPTEKKKGFGDWMNLMKPGNEEKDHWVPDEAVSKCTSCGADFGAFVRKHHCRNCGDIFCDKCTHGRIALTADENAQPVRVCDRCMAEVSHRLSNAKEAANKSAGPHTHEDLARKLQEEMEKNKPSSVSKSSGGSGRRMREVACPTCTVHLQVQVPSSGSETIECGVCQHPFLVSAH